MKQVTYDFSVREILLNLVTNVSNIEDGFWEILPITESMTTTLPPMVAGSDPSYLPGHFVRVRGFRLVKILGTVTVPELTVLVRDGRAVDLGMEGELNFVIDTNNSGPEQSSTSVGENSGPVGGDAPPADPRAGEIN